MIDVNSSLSPFIPPTNEIRMGVTHDPCITCSLALPNLCDTWPQGLRVMSLFLNSYISLLPLTKRLSRSSQSVKALVCVLMCKSLSGSCNFNKAD